VDLLSTEIVLTTDHFKEMIADYVSATFQQLSLDIEEERNRPYMKVSTTDNKYFGAALIISRYDKAMVRSLKRRLVSALRYRGEKELLDLPPFLELE